MTLRIGLGGFPPFLTPKSLGDGVIQIIKAPSISELISMSKSELSSSLEKLTDLDHVVFRLSGENPNEFIHILRLYGFLDNFKNREYSVAFWTMDSHHLVHQEAKAAKYFDTVFVAHKKYLRFFEESNPVYLPCSFSLAPANNVADYLSERTRNNKIEADGVCAPFAAYPWQKRNGAYAKALVEIDSLGIEKYFFGTVRGGLTQNDALISRMLDYKVILNLSLADDLNMRNFEALALNRILLTNRVPDHALLDEFRENIVYLKDGLTNFRAGLVEALTRTPEDYSKLFLQRHGIESRVLKIVETLSGYNPKAVDEPLAILNKPPAPSQNAQTNYAVSEVAHSAGDLLAKSGWVSISSFMTVVTGGKLGLMPLVRFVVLWVQSFGNYILKSSIGSAIFLRAVFRVFR